MGQDEDQVRGRAGGAGGGRRARGGRPAPWTPASSFIIKVMDYRELLDERILRCGERRSKAVVRPQRRSAPTHIGTFTPYICPDRASSPEITATSLDVPADGMARKTTHERYMNRHRSSRSEELTTNGASPRRGAHPKMTDPTRDRASSAEIIATWLYAPAGGMARKTTHERYLGRRRSSQSEELTTRTCIVPARCAPRK